MVFTSIEFISLFLPVTAILYFLSNKFLGLKSSNFVLLLCSLFFMFVGSASDIIILFLIVFICYLAGVLFALTKNKKIIYSKLVLIATTVISIGILAYYKYVGFLAQNVSALASLININVEFPAYVYKIMLPLGISFYTFQALSYVFDVYNKKVETTFNLFDFMLYVSFFPQIIAGPIVRYIDIYEQIQYRKSTVDGIYHGIIRFSSGAIKKVLIANTVAKAADAVFRLPIDQLNFSIAWVGVATYTLQIFLDFSAYSDMAIGLAKIFGFDLLENFNYPYIAKSVQDFWRRWHMSLSRWFRDYLYIPLGGNRKGKVRMYFNSFIVFLVCGLWHGADWVFILWGAWHGLFLFLEKLFLGKWLKKIPTLFSRIYTLLVVIFGWVMFRSTSMASAFEYMKRLVIPMQATADINRNVFEYLQNDIIIAGVLGILISAGVFRALHKWVMKNKVAEAIYGVIILILLFVSMASMYSDAYNPFIYFRF